MTKNLSRKLQPHLRTKSVNKTSHHAVSVTQFPAKQPLPAVSIHKPRHEGSQNVSTKNSSNNIFFYFLVLHQQANININLMICCLLHITCQIISELKHPRYCFPKFVSIWPAPEVVDGIFEVCPSATKFCPLVNKPVALGFSL